MNTLPPIAAKADPVTSHEAAASLTRSGERARQCETVLAGVRDHPGATSFELAVALGIDRHVSGRRLPDLMHQGRVRQGPSRTCHESGRRAVTWWLVERQTSIF